MTSPFFLGDQPYEGIMLNGVAMFIRSALMTQDGTTAPIPRENARAIMNAAGVPRNIMISLTVHNRRARPALVTEANAMALANAMSGPGRPTTSGTVERPGRYGRNDHARSRPIRLFRT